MGIRILVHGSQYKIYQGEYREVTKVFSYGLTEQVQTWLVQLLITLDGLSKPSILKPHYLLNCIQLLCMWNLAEDASSVAVYALAKYSSFESGWWPCESLFDQQNVMKVSCISLHGNYKSLEFFSLSHLECTFLGHSHLQPRYSQVKN